MPDLQKKPTLIFDFDGTLANTFDLIVDAVNALSKDYGIEPLSALQLDYLRGLPARKVLKMLGVAWYHIPELILKIQRYMKSRMHSIAMYPGIEDAIVALSADGFSLGIITSNTRENVEILLNKHHCNHFGFIHSARHVFGKSKTLKKIIHRQGLDTNHVYYIGDETRDIDAAKSCGIKSVAVSWGFNKRDLLMSSKPFLLIDDLAELQKQLSETITLPAG